jgi:hypothetical protein
MRGGDLSHLITTGFKTSFGASFGHFVKKFLAKRSVEIVTV